MSHSLSRAAIIGGLASLAALGAATSTAQAAQTATLDYRCKFPLIGTQPLKLDITLDVPDSVRSGEPTAPFAIKAVASVGGLGVPPLEPFGEVHTIGGVTDAQQPGKGTAARARVELADGSGINVRVPINVEPSTIVAPVQYPLVMNATGQAPSLTLDVPGLAKITLTELMLNLYGRYDDGTPVEGLTTPPTDIDRLPYADIDGDPGTFNVPCKLDPATQNLQLATFTVEHSDSCEISNSCPNQPPSKPGTPRATSTGTDRVTLFWNQATDDRGVTGYDVFLGETKVATVPNNSPYTVTGLAPNTTYAFRVEAFDADGARTSSDTVTLRTAAGLPGRQKATVNYRCKFPLIGTSPVAFEFGLDVPDTWPAGEPTEPFAVNVRATIGANLGISIVDDEGFELSSVSDSPTGSSLRLSVVPPNGSAIATRVALDFEPLSLVPPIPSLWVLTGSGTLPSWTVDDPGTTRINLVAPELNLRVRYVDGSPAEWWTTPPTDIDRQPYPDIDGDPATANVPCKPDPADQNMQLASFDTLGEPANLPPTKPTGLTAIPTQTSVALSWNASVDPDGTVASYNVYEGSTKVASVTGTTATISGLSPDVAHSFSVEAIDNDGAVSERSAALQVTTKVPPTTPNSKSYALAGSVKLATLMRGSLALKGHADLSYTPSGPLRQVSGTLDLGQTSGRLIALGFLPVTAKLGFVSSGAATGVHGGFAGSLTLNQKVRIKVLEAKLFGAIPLIGGNNCQTKQLTDLSLTSPGVFSTVNGGALAGTFKISDLNGCGALNGLVSPLTAGSGNAINLTLTPKA